MITNKKSYKLFWIGFVICLLLPFIFFLFTWELLPGTSFKNLHLYIHQPVFLQYMLFCMLPDLVVLIVGYKSNKMQLSQGGVLGVLPYMSALILLFF